MIEEKNHITVLDDVLIFESFNLATRVHSNHSVKIVVAEQAISVSHDRKLFTSNGLLIKSNTPHKIRPHDGRVISIFIDPQTQLGRSLNKLFKTKSVLRLEPSIGSKLFTFLSDSGDHVSSNQIRKRIARLLTPSASVHQEAFLDERIEKIVNAIKQSETCSVKFENLLQLCALSESRLIHLFKKEIGINIRKYMLWCRTTKAIAALTMGVSIKQSAKIAGFTDAAHFNRTFVSMYGIPPSLMLK